MKKFFIFALLSLVAFASVSSTATAQYSRREVAPPVTETEELDPSTPLGKVREIAQRLEAIEATTEEIQRAFEARETPDLKASLGKILEAAGATRADVARLGVIAEQVDYIAKEAEKNASAVLKVAENVEETAKLLRYVPTQESVDTGFKALEKRFVDASATQNDVIAALIDEKFSAARTASDADAQTLKNKLETASNIIILLGFGILALFAVNVAKFIFDKAQQAQQAERERRNAEIRELVATANKTGK